MVMAVPDWPIRSRPFRAEFRWTTKELGGGGMKVTIEEGAIYRDSDGRDRTEWIDPTRGVIDSAMIRDPRSAVLILLDLYRKRAVVEDIEPTPMGIEFYGGMGDKSSTFELNQIVKEKGVGNGQGSAEVL